MHMRIILLSVIALLINFVANGQGKPPIGGTATDTAWIRGSLQVDKQIRLTNFPNSFITTDNNSKVQGQSINSVLNLKTQDTLHRYSVSGSNLFKTLPYSVSVQSITYANDSNAVIVYREDTANGHVSNAAKLYKQLLTNNVWQTPTILYNSIYDDRYGDFYKTITGDTLITQIRRFNAGTGLEVDVLNAYSLDKGATLSTFQTVTSVPSGYIPYGIVEAEGKYYQLWAHSLTDTIRLYRSNNGLTNWTLISTVTQGAGSVEPTLAYAGNNTFIVLTRQPGGINPLRQYVSTNLGTSFTATGLVPFGSVQPHLLYDSKRKVLIAVATQRLNSQIYGAVNVYTAKPSEIATDVTKWAKIFQIPRPIPNVKAFLGANNVSFKNDSTIVGFIADAMQCDTGIIGDLCDKTSSWIYNITYSDKKYSNIGNIAGNVKQDSSGNLLVQNRPQAFVVNPADSVILPVTGGHLLFQQDPFNTAGKAIIINDASNTQRTVLGKNGVNEFYITNFTNATTFQQMPTYNGQGFIQALTDNLDAVAQRGNLAYTNLRTIAYGIYGNGLIFSAGASTSPADWSFIVERSGNYINWVAYDAGNYVGTSLEMDKTNGYIRMPFRLGIGGRPEYPFHIKGVGARAVVQDTSGTGVSQVNVFNNLYQGGTLIHWPTGSATTLFNGTVPAAGEVGITTNASKNFNIQTSGQYIRFGSSSAAPSVVIDNNTGSTTFRNLITVSGVSDYADNAAAIAAGLSVGTIYRTGDVLKIVH